MSKIDPKFREKWAEITKKNYAGQAKWMLNGFWDELQGEAEGIYKFWQKFCELDIQNKKEGHDLDEFYSHKFLETLGETLTVIALRERLRQIDLDNNNRMSLLEYLVFRYKKTVEQVVNSPQGDNKEELAEATALLESAQNALEQLQRRLEEQKRALAAQKKAEEEAAAAKSSAERVEAELSEAERQLREKESLVRKAEEENKAALDELHKQEQDYQNKIAALEKATQEGTVVQKNKAANELAQLKGEDPLPLRKAKITQESAVRKAEKARKEAEQATAEAKAKTDEAKAKRLEAERTLQASKRARMEAEEVARQVEADTLDAQKKFQEAQDYLEEVKKKGGVCYGDLWWIDREIKEAKKYLPKSKQ